MIMYGTPEQVATMASMWTDNGSWIDPVPDYDIVGTNPTLSEVNDWLDTMSAHFDVALESHSFVAPISPTTSPSVHKAVSHYVVSLVADLCHFKNSSGRFFTERLVERGITPMAAVLKDINSWIEMNADGLIGDGVAQFPTHSIEKTIKFRVVGKLS